MGKVSSKLKEELFALLPPTIYFFVALHIVAFVRVLMLKGTGIAPSSSISIAVAALILGKAVLIADLLPMINRFPNKPLIYIVAGNQKLLSEIIWPHFWAIQIILFVLIGMYCTMHELVRVMGREKVMRIFFGPMPVPQV